LSHSRSAQASALCAHLGLQGCRACAPRGNGGLETWVL